MKRWFYIILISLASTNFYAQSNLAVHLDGKDNRLRIGMDSICRNWTLEAWIKPDSDDWKKQEAIIAGGEYSKLNSLDYLPLIIENGRLCNKGAHLTGPEIPKGKWTYVAAVCNGKKTSLYVNGKEVASADTATVILPGAIGVHDNEKTAFGGCIDEVRIWSIGLTPKELNKWMYRPLTAAHPLFKHLKGYYNFDDFSEDVSLNRAAEGRLSFHLRNGRSKQYEKAPLAYAVINDNPLFHATYGKQKLFKAVALPTEWDADRGKRGFQLLKLRLEMQGEESPMSIKELELNLDECSNIADIKRIHIYNTGAKPRSEVRKELIAGGMPVTSGHMKISLPQNEYTQLRHGTNYILITADISSEAALGNTLDVKVGKVKIGGNSIVPVCTQDRLPVSVTPCSPDDPNVFKVLQWNIWHGGNHLGKDGRERIIDVIKESQADAVTMEEAYGSQQMIAEGTGFYWQTASNKANLCLFSRYPIQEIKTKNAFFSNPAIMELPNGKKLYINNCWLRYSYKPPYTVSFSNYGMDPHVWEKEDSIRGMADVKRLLENDCYPYVDSTMPIIIGGDFNSCSHLDWTKKAAPLHFGYEAEKLPTSRYMYEQGFKDSFREANPDELKRGEGTFAVIYGQLQTSRIDFIYRKGSGLRTVSSKIIRTLPEIDDVWPGDHAAVLTIFQME